MGWGGVFDHPLSQIRSLVVNPAVPPSFLSFQRHRGGGGLTPYRSGEEIGSCILPKTPDICVLKPRFSRKMFLSVQHCRGGEGMIKFDPWLGVRGGGRGLGLSLPKIYMEIRPLKPRLSSHCSDGNTGIFLCFGWDYSRSCAGNARAAGFARGRGGNCGGGEGCSAPAGM